MLQQRVYIGNHQHIVSRLEDHISGVDAIIDELRRYEPFCTFIDAPDGMPHARMQIIYALIRLCNAQQLTYLLRKTPPTATAYVTRRLDASILPTFLCSQCWTDFLCLYDMATTAFRQQKIFDTLHT